MALSHNLGFPRIGRDRELKKAVEAYWRGDIERDELLRAAREVREASWTLQDEAGLDHVPSNDFSLYDQVLDAAAMVGAVPERYGWTSDRVDLDTYFAMARGRKGDGDEGVKALEMTKWFDTNYHYIVPELSPGQTFRLGSTKPIDEFLEAKELGIRTRPVLLGPVTFLLLSKATSDGLRPIDLLDELLPVYEEVLRRLAAEGAEWVQMDEPCLVLDLDDETRRALRTAYETLASAAPGLDLLLATYFGDLRENLETAASLPVDALHVDRVRGRTDLADVVRRIPEEMSLSLGLVDGRNVWRTDLDAALEEAEEAAEVLGADRVLVGPSCSMLHAPVDLELETELDEEILGWLAFAKQKVAEVGALARAVDGGPEAAAEAFETSREAVASRRSSPRIHRPPVEERVADVDDGMLRRTSPYPERRPLQREALDLPVLPTTTIGSFPQTREVRRKRAAHRRGELDDEAYESFIEGEIEKVIAFQEDAGCDVLVHGEPERNDMVEYFGEQMHGFCHTRKAWVQSYGSRCVKPPIIFGDVARPEEMTVRWSTHAQAQTDHPVKGMLTGPVTILQWSFVRDDQPRSETCRQIALAIRDEVADLEAAGIRVIQIDEPAIREGLPLREADRDDYLRWAVDAFRLASGGARDETQIHTHMCYSEFHDMIESIAALDADVISIEASRSRMELLHVFEDFAYPNEIGPGVYDIHSPRVPPTDEMVDLIERALEVLRADQLWVNPDCGLKTRKWEDVRPALRNMVEAARTVRESIETGPAVSTA